MGVPLSLQINTGACFPFDPGHTGYFLNGFSPLGRMIEGWPFKYFQNADSR
jgi:hypothetical protein